MKENARPTTGTMNIKLFFAGLIAAVIIVVTICVVFVYQLKQVTANETDRYLTELSDSVAYSFNARMEANLNALESIAFTYAQGKSLNLMDMDYLQSKAEIQNFTRISVMAPDGVSVGSDGQFYDFSHSPEIMEALKGNRVVVNADRAYTGGQDGFAYAVPICEQDKITGAMVACNTAGWLDSLLSQEIFGGGAFFHIIESDGDFVIKSSNINVPLDGTNYFTGLVEHGQFFHGSSLEELERRVDAGEESTIYFQLDVDQVAKIAKLVPLSQPGLYLVLVVTEEAANRQFDTLQGKAVMSNVIIALLFIALAVLLFLTYNRSNRKLSELAFVDPVTQGYSQTRFELEATRLIETAPPGAYTFISLNISKFKLINDAFGAEEGNRTLKHIHDVILGHLCAGELLCRSSSDHFDLLVKSYPAEKILEHVRQVSEEINSFNHGSRQKYYLALSTGVYRVDDPALSIVHIRDRANVARKNSGAAQGNRLFSCVFYSDLEWQKQQHEKDMENKMDSALADGEFLVYLQPKVRLDDNRVVGAEALVRWLDKNRGLIPPDDFIPFFEQNGFVIQLDLYVFEQVCRLIRGWIVAGAEPVPVSVNLSRVHLGNQGFLEEFIRIQKQYSVPPELLEMELTETLLFENLEAVIKVIEQIHQAGYLCSLDDFGSGYSSLNLLKDVSIDILKLDRAFFRSPQADNPRERAIIESVVAMAKKLDMTTVSEGVETMYQLDFLRAIRCDMAQGYVISRPICIDDFERLVFGRTVTGGQGAPAEKPGEPPHK